MPTPQGGTIAQLTEKAKRLLADKSFGFLAELMPDGSPHVSPVWVDYDDDHVLVNTAEGRLKAENIRRDARVAISLSPPGNPYEHVDIRGRVVKIVDGEEAAEHIHELGRKYQGWDRYPLQEGERRLKLWIEPTVVC